MISILEKATADLLYEDYRRGIRRIDDLSVEDLRTLLAFEHWCNGMEEEEVLELWNDQSKTREEIMYDLVNIFGY